MGPVIPDKLGNKGSLPPPFVFPGNWSIGARLTDE